MDKKQIACVAAIGAVVGITTCAVIQTIIGNKETKALLKKGQVLREETNRLIDLYNRDFVAYSRSYEIPIYSFSSKEECEKVIKQLRNILTKNKFVTVANYIMLINQTPSFEDYDYGWTNLYNVSIFSFLNKEHGRVYGIRFPDPILARLLHID